MSRAEVPIENAVAVHEALSALGAAGPAGDTGDFRARLFAIFHDAHEKGVHSLAGPLVPDAPPRSHEELASEPAFVLLAYADDALGVGYYAIPAELLLDDDHALLRQANGAVFGESLGLPAPHATGVLNVLVRIGEQDVWTQLMTEENELSLPDAETLRELTGEWAWHGVSQPSELDRRFVSVVSLLRKR